MTFSLYAALVPSYRRLLASTAGLIDKAAAFAGERGMTETDIVEARLADDMLPFGYQVKAVVGHSAGAIEGVRRGVFSPDRSPWPASFAALKTHLTDADAALAAIDPAEIDGFVGRDMRFEFGQTVVPYVAEDFLLSFSQPNFYFHATTAYAILRSLGVSIGKRDYIGRPRSKPAA